jgi:hypothetical protein
MIAPDLKAARLEIEKQRAALAARIAELRTVASVAQARASERAAALSRVGARIAELDAERRRLVERMARGLLTGTTTVDTSQLRALEDERRGLAVELEVLKRGLELADQAAASGEAAVLAASNGFVALDRAAGARVLR